MAEETRGRLGNDIREPFEGVNGQRSKIIKRRVWFKKSVENE